MRCSYRRGVWMSWLKKQKRTVILGPHNYTPWKGKAQPSGLGGGDDGSGSGGGRQTGKLVSACLIDQNWLKLMKIDYNLVKPDYHRPHKHYRPKKCWGGICLSNDFYMITDWTVFQINFAKITKIYRQNYRCKVSYPLCNHHRENSLRINSCKPYRLVTDLNVCGISLVMFCVDNGKFSIKRRRKHRYTFDYCRDQTCSASEQFFRNSCLNFCWCHCGNRPCLELIFVSSSFQFVCSFCRRDHWNQSESYELQ